MRGCEVTKDEAIQQALVALGEFGYHGSSPRWERAVNDLRTALEQPPLPVQPEPLEYWNAVEGWVKIDEVREHFDAVNCGTIYKHGGEGRVPLYTAPPQRQWVGLTDEEMSDIVADIDADFGDLLWKVVCLTKIIQAELKERNA